VRPSVPRGDAAARPVCARGQAALPVPGVVSPDPVLQLASGLDQPDDLLSSGDLLLVGEYGSGTIARVDGPGGRLVPLPARVPEVEGLALAGPTLLAADQLHDRVVAVTGRTVRTRFQLRPVAGVEGVDNVATAGGALVVPDSARGAVDLLARSGRVVRRLTGFDRPTGVWPTADGTMLVADENAGTVLRVQPDGARTVLARGLDLPDDVARRGSGPLYVIAIGSDALDTVAGGSAQELVGGLGQPQGLALDGAGNPVVTESSAGRVDLVVVNVALVPSGPVAAVARGARLCVQLARGPGYHLPVTILPGRGYRVVAQPGRGDRGEVLPGRCTTTCRVRVAVRSGRLTGATWLAYRTVSTG